MGCGSCWCGSNQPTLSTCLACCSSFSLNSCQLPAPSPPPSAATDHTFPRTFLSLQVPLSFLSGTHPALCRFRWLSGPGGTFPARSLLCHSACPHLPCAPLPGPRPLPPICSLAPHLVPPAQLATTVLCSLRNAIHQVRPRWRQEGWHDLPADLVCCWRWFVLAQTQPLATLIFPGWGVPPTHAPSSPSTIESAHHHAAVVHLPPLPCRWAPPPGFASSDFAILACCCAEPSLDTQPMLSLVGSGCGNLPAAAFHPALSSAGASCQPLQPLPRRPVSPAGRHVCSCHHACCPCAVPLHPFGHMPTTAPVMLLRATT